MKAAAVGFVVLALVVLSSLAGVTSAVSYDRNYSDPASDVEKLWTSNMTPVLDPSGNATLTPFPDNVNILWLRSANASANVTVTIEVKGNVANLDNATYEVRLYTRADNASHFIVSHRNGTTTLTSNATGFAPKDITGNSTIFAAGSNPTLTNGLRINVSKSLLGTIDDWNIDTVATQSGPTYTYRDSGWKVPGNPGSTPTPSPTPSGLPTWLWITVAVTLVAVALVAIAIATRRKRTPPKT